MTYDHWKTTEPDPFEDEFEDFDGVPDCEDCECGENTCVCETPAPLSSDTIAATEINVTNKPDQINGYQIDLDGDRYVFVSEQEDRFLIAMRNAKGEMTRFALSKEAAQALRYLLGGHVPAAETVQRFLTHMVKTDDASTPAMEWQVVPTGAPPQTAPQTSA
jgi:hypothetical protein